MPSQNTVSSVRRRQHATCRSLYCPTRSKSSNRNWEQICSCASTTRCARHCTARVYGARVVEMAGHILNDAQKIRDTATEFRNPEAVPLTIGMTPILAPYLTGYFSELFSPCFQGCGSRRSRICLKPCCVWSMITCWTWRLRRRSTAAPLWISLQSGLNHCFWPFEKGTRFAPCHPSLQRMFRHMISSGFHTVSDTNLRGGFPNKMEQPGSASVST